MKTYNDLIQENNAMLKVLLRNQALTMVILEEAIEKLNENSVGTSYLPAMQDLREKAVSIQYRKLIAMSKLILSGGDIDDV